MTKHLLPQKTQYTLSFLLLLVLWMAVPSCQPNYTDEELFQKCEEAFEKKEWLVCVGYYDLWIERYPMDVDAVFYRAMAYTNMGQLDKYNEEILFNLDRVLELDPVRHDARFLRFQTRFLQGDLENAQKDIDYLITLRGELPLLLSWKGNTAFAAKDFATAEKAYETCLKFQGPYEEMKNIYYYWVFSKYFGGNKEGAMWDSAFLPDRGFEADTALIRQISEDLIKWENVANFQIPQMRMDDIRQNLGMTGPSRK